MSDTFIKHFVNVYIYVCLFGVKTYLFISITNKSFQCNLHMPIKSICFAKSYSPTKRSGHGGVPLFVQGTFPRLVLFVYYPWIMNK